jgi:hypothetical protein
MMPPPMSRPSLRQLAPLLVPLAILVILAAPSVTFMLPATEDYLGEIYQPLQALKFFKTKGSAFHKYGPTPNFILAPGYGATLAYWKVTGAFARPSENFPYGFSRPFEQMGVMILQARLIFLLIGVVGVGYLGYTLTLVTENRRSVAFALIFCVATNYALVEQLPSPRPDSGMLAFSALALAVYVRMLFFGLTIRRGVFFSVWAVFAIGCKELAAPMFVLPFLGLIWIAFRQHAPEARRTIRWSFVAGVAAYVLTNVIYAPRTWQARMHYWLGGPGIDADVWGHGGGPLGRLIGFGECMLNNLGPGGVLVVPVALLFFLMVRPTRWLMLLLPAVSVLVLGLAKIQYPADRFYAILCLALVPAVAVGVDAVVRRAGRVAVPAMVFLAVVNGWWATFAVLEHSAIFERVAERHALARNDRDATYKLFSNFPHNPGSTRLEYLGLKHDPRSIQQLATQRTNLPQWLYATRGKLQFFEDARRMPARIAMIKKDSGFDVATWSGMEGLGYERYETIIPTLPGWMAPLEWMPAVKRWRALRAVEVYRLPAAATRVTTTPTTSSAP